MNFDTPIICQTFGVGLTVDGDNPAMAVMMGEDDGEPPTHAVLFDAEGFARFVQRCMILAAEITSIHLELDGLEGDERHSRLEEIQERYSAGLN